MATRKPDAEVGPIGVWAYSARTSLKGSDGGELQPEEVAPLLPKPPHPATIRRIESNPTYNPEKMVRPTATVGPIVVHSHRPISTHQRSGSTVASYGGPSNSTRTPRGNQSG